MTRYTTGSVTLVFEEPGVLENIASVRVTLEQDGHQLTKKDDEVTVNLEDNSVFISLTQEETGSFKEAHVYIQVRIKYTNGQVIASEIERVYMNKILDEEVM